MRINVLNVNYNNYTMEFALEEANKLLEKSIKSNIFFLNAHCLRIAQFDKKYRNIINATDLILPDGIGLRLITLLSGKNMIDNCNGTDFSPLFMELLSKKNVKIFFLGGKEGVAEKAKKKIGKLFPQVDIIGTHHGYFENSDQVIDIINASGADVLFVSMGVPLQEKWIYLNRTKLNPHICLGVGALLDFLSGSKYRAPRFIRKCNLEWLWRIIVEPKRMFGRYFFDAFILFFICLLPAIFKNIWSKLYFKGKP
jgi:N-acetylglucosaminyldiphosphoundecaprenol N-acetyl-beta-D-mannosaminyltransferase